MKIFDTTPKSGMPVRSGIFFRALLRMARAWEMLAVHNGHVDWSNGMPTIVVDETDTEGIDVEGSATNRHLVWDTGEDPAAWVANSIFAGFTESVPVTFVTDVQFANNLFQKKTRTLIYEAGIVTISSETEWTTITGGTAETCP